MRLIDADAFLKRNEVYADCEFLHPMYQNTLREIVDDEPTIDAVEVVRCKDCIHYNAGFECLAEGYGIEREPNWFCADGERREG